MANVDVTIKILSPIHLGSGQADVNVDAEIVHDAFGLPYFPAKRFKGLLYESALEVREMFELSGLDTQNLSPLEKIFHRQSVSEVQLIVPNFFIAPPAKYKQLCAEWKFLQTTFPKIFTAKMCLIRSRRCVIRRGLKTAWRLTPHCTICGCSTRARNFSGQSHCSTPMKKF